MIQGPVVYLGTEGNPDRGVGSATGCDGAKKWARLWEAGAEPLWLTVGASAENAPDLDRQEAKPLGD